MGPISEQWALIVDLIGPVDEWPRDMRSLFWKNGTLVNGERFKLCTFGYINGLDRNILLQWCQLRGLLRDDDAWHHIHGLYNAFENTTQFDTRYWQWNVINRRYQYINGTPRYY